ncbi:MAG: DUF6048 family protein [Bacteroidota bacterium]
MRATCRYIYILALNVVLVCCAANAKAQQDTAAVDTTGEEKKAPKVQAAGRQLCVGVDIFHPVLNNYLANSYGYELTADYFLKNEFYAVAEGGWGGSKVDYTDLQYTTTNTFLRAGFNKSMLLRDHPRDWDLMFFGMRAGFANITRSNAAYIVQDSLWGNTTGIQPGKNFNAYWLEVNAGMRIELLHGLCAGWTIRGKFLMNGKAFKDLAPLYIAGYGRGDKGGIFDFNFYISYAIRWQTESFNQAKSGSQP